MDIKDLMKGIAGATRQFSTMAPDKTNKGRTNRVNAQKHTRDHVAAKAATSNAMKYKKK